MEIEKCGFDEALVVRCFRYLLLANDFGGAVSCPFYSGFLPTPSSWPIQGKAHLFAEGWRFFQIHISIACTGLLKQETRETHAVEFVRVLLVTKDVFP